MSLLLISTTPNYLTTFIVILPFFIMLVLRLLSKCALFFKFIGKQRVELYVFLLTQTLFIFT